MFQASLGSSASLTAHPPSLPACLDCQQVVVAHFSACLPACFDSQQLMVTHLSVGSPQPVLPSLQDGKEVVVEAWVSRYKQPLLVGLAVVVFTLLLSIPIFKEPEKQNCLALLVFASLLWCTEAIPLFVTSMLVPFLIVVLRVLDDVEQEPPARLTPKQAAPAVFHTMFSQVGGGYRGFHEREPVGCAAQWWSDSRR